MSQFAVDGLGSPDSECGVPSRDQPLRRRAGPTACLAALLIVSVAPHASHVSAGVYQDEVDDGENGKKSCRYSNGSVVIVHWQEKCRPVVLD